MRVELVGGPLDGRIVSRAAAPPPFVHVAPGPPIRFYAAPGAGRLLYRVVTAGKLLYAGDRLLLCPGCGCYHESAWVDDCTLCGATLRGARA